MHPVGNPPYGFTNHVHPEAELLAFAINGITNPFVIGVSTGPGRISITRTPTELNRCRKPDGKIKDAAGRAKIVDPATNAKLKVSFFGPFYGDYWVLDHADDYAWSIVGEPSGRYLWLLSRDATPGKERLEALIARAQALGYDTSMLRITQQP